MTKMMVAIQCIICVSRKSIGDDIHGVVSQTSPSLQILWNLKQCKWKIFVCPTRPTILVGLLIQTKVGLFHLHTLCYFCQWQLNDFCKIVVLSLLLISLPWNGMIFIGFLKQKLKEINEASMAWLGLCLLKNSSCLLVFQGYGSIALFWLLWLGIRWILT